MPLFEPFQSSTIPSSCLILLRPLSKTLEVKDVMENVTGECCGGKKLEKAGGPFAGSWRCWTYWALWFMTYVCCTQTMVTFTIAEIIKVLLEADVLKTAPYWRGLWISRSTRSVLYLLGMATIWIGMAALPSLMKTDITLPKIWLKSCFFIIYCLVAWLAT